MFPIRDCTFGEQCPVLVKRTFIDVQCPEEEHRPVIRRQMSDPLFANIGSKILYPTSPLRCEEPLKKLLVEAPPTPTTCDECSTGFESLTPITSDDCDEVYDEDDIKVHGSAFCFADAVKHLEENDVTYEEQQDAAAFKVCYELPLSQVPQAAPMLSTQQQTFPTEYQWTGDASSRVPMMSSNIVQDQRSNYLDNVQHEALAMPLSPPCDMHGNYYHETTGGYGNAGLQHQHCDYYNQVLDTATILPPPPPPPAQSPKISRATKPCAAQAEETTEAQTTLMVRNLPNDLSQPLLVDEFKAAGYGGLFDFVYMPMNFRGQGNFGYAFVNFVTHEVAVRFMSHAKAIQHGSEDASQAWDAVWSTCQGLSANIDRYRNSPLMHELVPRECKPAVYDAAGLQVAFPAPTKNIPKPRIHWPSPVKGVKDTQVPMLAQGSLGGSSQDDLVPERRPGRSKNHQRQQVTMQRRK